LQTDNELTAKSV